MELKSFVEHTLHFRPDHVPTEMYLKSQRLWIMHKLLMRIPGVRDKIQLLLAAAPIAPGPSGPTPEQQMETAQLRTRLAQLLAHFQHRLAPTGPTGTFSICEDLSKSLAEFQHVNHAALESEKRLYVERRCEIIRWCAWCVCTYGKEWLSRVDVNVLHNGLEQWISNRAGFPPPPPPTLQTSSLPDSPAVVRK